MFKVLILVCSINLAPAECQTDTAVDVISGPEAGNQSMCGLYGQAYIADTALGTALRSDEYVKVKCTRTASTRMARAPDASKPAPMTLAQTPSPLTLVCCFGGTSSGQCTQSSPNQPGCEFVMAYNCGKAGYSCDAGKGVCSCNTTAADSGLPQPSQ